MAFDAIFNLSALDGSNGFSIRGIDSLDISGTSVSGIGDINGDGIDDFIIGAPDANSTVGASYVVFGTTETFTTGLNLSDLDGTNGFVITGIETGDFAGIAVSGVGDVNGDGLNDWMIGASGASPNSSTAAGETYVVFGSSNGFDASLSLASLDSEDGFVINGISAGDLSGGSVSVAGDINNDGIDDLIIGAINGNSGEGQSYVVFGSEDGFDSSIDAATLIGTNGFVINGIDTGDFAGIAVSGAGDINDDGIEDVVIGAAGANAGTGETYVLFGSDEGFSGSFNLSDLDGSNGFKMNGITTIDGTGGAVSSAGDINGDGIADLIIGASGANDGAGASYVVFGSNDSFNASLNLEDLDGSNGFVVNGVERLDLSGISVSSLGDINGDSVDDLIIGATAVDEGTGASYVVYGDRDGFEGSLNLADLDGDNGFVINGIASLDLSGTSVKSAGDVNGDGAVDLIIGAPGVNEGTGETYVVFGIAGEMGTALSDINFDSGTAGDSLSGSSDDDTLRGTRNNDELQGKGGDDTLVGKNGKDNLQGNGGDDKLQGGKDRDQLIGNKGSDRLIGQNGKDILIGGRGDDILIGGKAKDMFVYTSLNDGTDTIRKFEVKKDVIDLRQIFESSEFGGSSDFGRFSEFVDLATVNGNTEVRVDADGNGSETEMVTLAVVKGITTLSSSNFVVS